MSNESKSDKHPVLQADEEHPASSSDRYALQRAISDFFAYLISLTSIRSAILQTISALVPTINPIHRITGSATIPPKLSRHERFDTAPCIPNHKVHVTRIWFGDPLENLGGKLLMPQIRKSVYIVASVSSQFK